jgi:hypothetical protein
MTIILAKEVEDKKQILAIQYSVQEDMMLRKFAIALSLLMILSISFGADVQPVQAQEPIHNLNKFWG